jgi:hypothetical protein
LDTLTRGPNVTSYSYSGLGDRLQETTNGVTTTFVMDLNMGLTQALSDGTNTYLYGAGRIAQQHGTTTEYFLGDALGSVRQMTDANGVVTYARAYDPYGVVTQTSGASQSSYGYTSEYQGGLPGLGLPARPSLLDFDGTLSHAGYLEWGGQPSAVVQSVGVCV